MFGEEPAGPSPALGQGSIAFMIESIFAAGVGEWLPCAGEFEGGLLGGWWFLEGEVDRYHEAFHFAAFEANVGEGGMDFVDSEQDIFGLFQVVQGEGPLALAGFELSETLVGIGQEQCRIDTSRKLMGEKKAAPFGTREVMSGSIEVIAFEVKLTGRLERPGPGEAIGETRVWFGSDLFECGEGRL